jgi:putative ABC transport system permease protein
LSLQWFARHNARVTCIPAGALDHLMRELRYAIRLFWTQPGFSAAALITLALGIGANTAVFSVLNAAVLHPLSYSDPDRLLMLRDLQTLAPETNVSFPEFVDWRTRSGDIAEVGAYFNTTLTMGGAEPRTVMAQQVSTNLCRALGVTPLMGRHFQIFEEGRTADRVIAISQALWERQLGSDPQVIGRTLTLNDAPHTIVAVMPRDFRGVLPRDISAVDPKEVWLPLRLDEASAPRGFHVMTVLARLRHGITLDQARERLTAIAVGLKREGRTTHGIAVHPLVTYVAESARPMLLALSGAVAVVLLMACANLANLLLARGTASRQEIAIRAAIGATHRWILSAHLVEACVLSVAGGAAGLALVIGSLRALSGIAGMSAVNLAVVHIDFSVLAFTAVTSLAAGLLFTIAPVIQALRTGVQPLLQESGRTTTGATGIRGLLVTVEMGLAVLLVVAAGLLARSFGYVLDVPKGFETTGVLSFNLSASRVDVQTNRHPQFFANPLERLSAIPQVTSVGLVNELPLGGGGVSGETPIEGRAFPNDQVPVADKRIVSRGYFETMGIRLIRGRTFSADDGAGALPVAVVSELFAQRYFPGEDPIGRRVSFEWEMDGRQEIIGVVGDVRHEGLDVSPSPTIYVNYEQRPASAFSVVVKSRAPLSQLADDVRESAHAVNASRPLNTVRTLDEVIDSAVAPRRLALQIIGAFAIIALVLAAIGVFGVASYSAQQRTKEIGLHVALGAQPADVVVLMIRKILLLAGIGLGTGLAGSIAARHVIEAYLFAVSSTDVATALFATALLGAVALIASYLPVRRALRVGPIKALQGGPR